MFLARPRVKTGDLRVQACIRLLQTVMRLAAIRASPSEPKQVVFKTARFSFPAFAPVRPVSESHLSRPRWFAEVRQSSLWFKGEQS